MRRRERTIVIKKASDHQVVWWVGADGSHSPHPWPDGKQEKVETELVEKVLTRMGMSPRISESSKDLEPSGIRDDCDIQVHQINTTITPFNVQYSVAR